MPILKSTDQLPKRPVIILIYGEPGLGKTTVFNTSATPLLIDFDRGKDRAIFRQDTLVVNNWQDVEAEERAGTFKDYKTIGIDTAKAALDDFLMAQVIADDYKNKTNKLKAYGAIGDRFKLFISNRRGENADIVIICHSKDEKEGETIKKIPDVTGGSYNLLLRIADQVGYMGTINNQRVITWNPTDRTIGKNVANLETTIIPDKNEAGFKTFLAGIIEKVKESIVSMSEAQKEALETKSKYEELIASAGDAGELTLLAAQVQSLPKTLAVPLASMLQAKAKEQNLSWTGKEYVSIPQSVEA